MKFLNKIPFKYKRPKIYTFITIWFSSGSICDCIHTRGRLDLKDKESAPKYWRYLKPRPFWYINIKQLEQKSRS